MDFVYFSGIVFWLERHVIVRKHWCREFSPAALDKVFAAGTAARLGAAYSGAVRASRY